TPTAGHGGTAITAALNYDARGAHFVAGVSDPILGGNGVSGYELTTPWFGVGGPHTWITAYLTAPARAVGIWRDGGTTLHAYDVAGHQLGCVSYSASGGPYFIGIVSLAEPIVRVAADDNSES